MASYTRYSGFRAWDGSGREILVQINHPDEQHRGQQAPPPIQPPLIQPPPIQPNVPFRSQDDPPYGIKLGDDSAWIVWAILTGVLLYVFVLSGGGIPDLRHEGILGMSLAMIGVSGLLTVIYYYGGKPQYLYSAGLKGLLLRIGLRTVRTIMWTIIWFWIFNLIDDIINNLAGRNNNGYGPNNLRGYQQTMQQMESGRYGPGPRGDR